MKKYDNTFLWHPEVTRVYSEELLFPKKESPSIDEIQQEQIQNNFLCATRGILGHPQGGFFLRSMMTLNDDGTTTVRLFHPDTLEPNYISVDMAGLVDKQGQPLNKHKALWVDVLETAYVAFIKRPNESSDEAVRAISVLTGLKRTCLDVSLKEQDNLYFSIKKALNEGGGFVVAHSKAKEGLKRTLHPLFDIYEKKLDIIDPPSKGRITLKVKYVVLENQSGKVEMEFTDFCRKFSRVDINPSVDSLFMHSQKYLELAGLAKEILSAPSIQKESTFTDLGKLKKQHEEYGDKLIELETLLLDYISSTCKIECGAIFQEGSLQERDCIYEVLKDKPYPPLYAGDQVERTERLYRLLKLQWLKNQNPLDHHSIAELKFQIITNAPYPFCARMAEEKINLDVLAKGNAQGCQSTLEVKIGDAQALINKLKDLKPDTLLDTQLEKKDEEENAEEVVIFSNYRLLNKLIAEIASISNTIQDLDSLNSDHNISERISSIFADSRDFTSLIERNPNAFDKYQNFKKKYVDESSDSHTKSTADVKAKKVLDFFGTQSSFPDRHDSNKGKKDKGTKDKNTKDKGTKDKVRKEKHHFSLFPGKNQETKQDPKKDKDKDNPKEKKTRF